MFENRKIKETVYNCWVTYEVNKYDVLELLRYNEEVKSIEFEEDADVGMHAYGGRYSRDDFFELYDNTCIDTESYIICFKDGTRMFLRDDFISIITEDRDFDLEEYLTKRTKGE